MCYKILFFANSSLIGGAERNILDLSAHLFKKGYQVYIAVLEKGGPLIEIAKNIGLKTFDPHFEEYYKITYIKRIYSFLKKNDFDFVIIYGLKLKIILIPLCFLLHKPIIISMILGLDIWKNKIHLLLEKFLEPFTSLWIANSDAAMKNAIEREGKPKNLVQVIKNGIPINSNHSKKFQNHKNKKFRIITVANIQKDKGHFLFLKAIKKLIDLDSDFIFEFIGNDYTKGKFVEEIKQLKLEKYVQYSGYISNVRSFLHNFDLMVLPSFAESLPTSIIESMLEGIPVLATRVGGIPELIDHDETGWLIPPNNENSLVDQIQYIKNNRAKLNLVSQNAFKFASEHFDIKNIAQEYEKIFKNNTFKKQMIYPKYKIIRVQSRIVIGGPAKQTILLSKELNRNGYKTILIGGASKSIEKSLIESALTNGIKCVVIPEMAREIHFYDDLISLVKLYKFIKKEKPVIFHSHTAKAGGIGRIAAYIAGVPLIFHTFHGHVFSGYFGKLKTKAFILIERLLSRISTKIIVISKSQKHDIIQIYKIGTESRVELIRLGFNWNENFLKRSNLNLRNNFKIPPNKFLVGIIGRLVSIKDHNLFIEIAEKLLLIENNDYHFVIIGDGELKSNLINLVKSKNIEKYFTFTGWIEINRSIYRELDLLLLTSKNEGTPVTIIEALASGIPVIASDVGGVRDVMQLYNKEFLIRDRNPYKYYEKILKLREISDRPSKKTQAKVMQTYDSERLVMDIKNLYKKSIEKVNQSFVSLDK